MRETALGLDARGESRAEAKSGECHQFAPRHRPRNKALSLTRIGWLYPIFRRYMNYGARNKCGQGSGNP